MIKDHQQNCDSSQSIEALYVHPGIKSQNIAPINNLPVFVILHLALARNLDGQGRLGQNAEAAVSLTITTFHCVYPSRLRNNAHDIGAGHGSTRDGGADLHGNDTR